MFQHTQYLNSKTITIYHPILDDNILKLVEYGFFELGIK